MASYLGNFPNGSSPVAIFSGAGSMRAAPPVNLSGVPAHLRAQFAARFSGFGAAGDNLVSEDSKSWYEGIDWASVSKGVGSVADALSKVMGREQVAQMSQAQQYAMAQQLAAQQRARALPAWVMPVAIVAGAGILGAILWKVMK